MLAPALQPILEQCVSWFDIGNIAVRWPPVPLFHGEEALRLVPADGLAFLSVLGLEVELAHLKDGGVAVGRPAGELERGSVDWSYFDGRVLAKSDVKLSAQAFAQ